MSSAPTKEKAPETGAKEEKKEDAAKAVEEKVEAKPMTVEEGEQSSSVAVGLTADKVRDPLQYQPDRPSCLDNRASLHSSRSEDADDIAKEVDQERDEGGSESGVPQGL